MRMLRYFYTVCLGVLIFSLQSAAQDTKVLVKPGERCFKKEQYKNAYPYFEQILKTDPENLNALYKSGVCNLHRFSKEQALINLEKVYAKDSTYNKYLYFWMARAYHLNYDFDKAFIFYKKFQEKISKNNIQYKEVERYKYQLTCGADYISNPGNYKVQNIGSAINSSYSEHSPVLSQADTLLLFTSRRANVIDKKEEYDGEPFENIFYSHKIDSITWSAPESFQLNTSGHDASIQLYDNDTKLFIYSYLHGGDIYTSEKINGTWSTPVSLKEINSIDFEADVFLTADGKTLYYATNHFKKNGDLDIYYLTKNADNTWSKPQSLSALNTDEDEDAPYITADGKTMYFSSRGHTSMGGYDIFRSTLDTATGSWTKPVNLGYPVNTPDEDLYFILSHTSVKGYMSSYRTGGYGEKDIYEVTPIEEAAIKGLLVDKNNVPVKREGLIVQIVPVETASKNAKSAQATVANDGSFAMITLSDNNYTVVVLDGRDTIATDTLHVALTGEKNKAINYTCVIPDAKRTDTTTVTVPTDIIAATPVSAKTIQQTVYYAVNIFSVGPASKAELRKLVSFLEANPNAIISISGHADGSGSEFVNKTLSLKRANGVKEYIESKGILSSRIKVSSYGSSKPVASNATEAGRAKNRRVEIVVE